MRQIPAFDFALYAVALTTSAPLRSQPLAPLVQQVPQVPDILFQQPCTPDDGKLCGSVSRISPKEKVMLQSIFGNQIKTDAIRKFYQGGGNDDIAFVPNDNVTDIIFYGGNNHRLNYAVDLRSYKDVKRVSPANREALLTFIHETVHLWQNQQKKLFTAAKIDRRALSSRNADDYGYRLARGVDFSAYAKEQQTSIIEDYVSIVFLNDRFGENYIGPDNKNMRGILVTMVEKQFPEIGNTRYAFQTKAAPSPIPVSLASYRPGGR